MGITLLYYDSRELLSLLYDLRCDHNYNAVYAARRIIYGRQTRLGFVIVNIFFFTRIFPYIPYNRSDIYVNQSDKHARCTSAGHWNLFKHVYAHVSDYITDCTYIFTRSDSPKCTIPHKCQLHRNGEKPFWIGTSYNFMKCIENM